MRLALVSDIHGNSVALDAVLSELESQGVIDKFLFLGDYVAFGPDPVGVLERITRLQNASFIYGNTDRFVFEGVAPRQTPESVASDPSELRRLVEFAQQVAWTQGALSSRSWLKWLDDLPLELRDTLPDGTVLLAVHASPGKHSGPGFNPVTSDDSARSMLKGCDADLVCIGHTHVQIDRRVELTHVLSPGSVSNPTPDDLRAKYAIIDADSSGYKVSLRQVDYDRDLVISQCESQRQASSDFVTRRLRGQNPPPWT